MPQQPSLSASEVNRFANEGYLVRFGSLTSAMIGQLLEALDVADEGYVDSGEVTASAMTQKSSESTKPSPN